MIARRRGVRARAAQLFASLAPVQRGELTTVVLLTINVFVLLTCYDVLKVVREPLILLGGGAELKAYASAGQALLLIAVVPGFGRLSSRVSRLRLLTTIQFLPTTRAAKYKAKAAIDTFFFRIGDVIAGLGIVFLLVRVLGLGIRAFAVLNLCLSVCWILLAYRTGRMYDEMAADHVEPEAHPARVAA